MRLTEITQNWLRESIKPGDIVIDATLGNGFDAQFLAEHIGSTGTIFGFDVQPEAITQSEKLLSSQPCNQTFYLKGHEHIATTLPLEHKGEIKAIMFNLGWLPGSDKSIITATSTTISALEQSISWLAANGKLSVMVYPGHEGGDTEAKAVISWLEQTCLASNNTMQVQKIVVPDRPKAPMLIQVTKHS
ncbi:MAG: class I SAM-dependent methyltransferase [Ghiorsea sp.]